MQTGAALHGVTLWFTEEGWVAHASPAIPVPAEGSRREKAAAMTQEIARNFEKGITEHPEDWHMLQRVFLATSIPPGCPGRARNRSGSGAEPPPEAR